MKSWNNWRSRSSRSSGEERPTSHARVLRSLFYREGNVREFNLVWDYTLPIAYLTFVDFLGIKFPVRTGLASRLALLMRNIKQAHPPVRCDGIQGRRIECGIVVLRHY